MHITHTHSPRRGFVRCLQNTQILPLFQVCYYLNYMRSHFRLPFLVNSLCSQVATNNALAFTRILYRLVIWDRAESHNPQALVTVAYGCSLGWRQYKEGRIYNKCLQPHSVSLGMGIFFHGEEGYFYLPFRERHLKSVRVVGTYSLYYYDCKLLLFLNYL